MTNEDSYALRQPLHQAMMQSLMAQRQQQALQATEPIVKMRAGKMEVVSWSPSKMVLCPSHLLDRCVAHRQVKNSPTNPGKFIVSPKPEKGLLQVVKDEQGIPKFQWKNRVTDAVDPTCDHMVFPGTASFKKTGTGRAGDRVVLLQFTGSERRFFFWLQDKDEAKDDELIATFADVLNGIMPAEDAPPPEVAPPASAAAAAAAAVSLGCDAGIPGRAPFARVLS
jgi:hypothetical protein